MATFEGGKYLIDDMPPVTKVPIEEILEQHRYRYVLQTSKGTVVMKHLSKRLKLHIDRIRYLRFPQAYVLEQEAKVVYPLVMAGNAEEDTVRRANEIAAQLAPTMDLYMLGIIEYPFLTTPEDFYGFLKVLKEEEAEALRQMQIMLTAWDRPVDYSQLEIAERFHIQKVRPEHIDDPTYQQYRALYSVIEQEHEAVKGLYEKVSP